MPHSAGCAGHNGHDPWQTCCLLPDIDGYAHLFFAVVRPTEKDCRYVGALAVGAFFQSIRSSGAKGGRWGGSGLCTQPALGIVVGDFPAAASFYQSRKQQRYPADTAVKVFRTWIARYFFCGGSAIQGISIYSHGGSSQCNHR